MMITAVFIIDLFHDRGILSDSQTDHIIGCFGQGLITAPFRYILNKKTNELRRDAIKTLVKKITMMYIRMYDLDDADMPSFQDFSSSMSRVYYRAPITVFRLWKAYVKYCVRKKGKKDVNTIKSKDEDKALLEYHTFK